MKKMYMGIGLCLAGAAFGAYMMMPSRSKRKIKRGLQDTVDDVKDLADDLRDA